jgi:hypothetical protein
VVRREDPRQWAFHFLARVAGSKWEIRISPMPGATAKQNQYDECIAVSDGQTVYCITELSKAMEQAIGQRKAAPVNSAEGLVYTSHPLPNVALVSSPMSIVWLAFCSDSFFGALSSEYTPVPISENVCSGESIHGRAALEYRQRSYWLLPPTNPRCPKGFWSVDDGYIKQVKGSEVVRTDRRYPAPFTLGFTNISFKAIDYFRLNDFYIPRYAELLVYSILNKKPGGRILNLEDLYIGPLSCVVHLRLEVEQANEWNKEIPFPPQFLGIATVNDWRFAFSNRLANVFYFATNRFLSPEEVKTLEPYYSQAQKRWQAEIKFRHPVPLQRPSTTWFWASAVSLTLLIWGAFRVVKTRNQKTTQHQPEDIYEHKNE